LELPPGQQMANFGAVKNPCILVSMVSNPSPRILLVDDEPALLLSYRIIFERAGYSVATADTTQNALALLNEQSFDILLCDLTIEHEDSGLRIIDAAHKIAPKMPAVLMTGYSDESIPQQVIDSGVNVVFKPVEIRRLLGTVDFLVRGHKRPDLKTRA
jgi:DNA-binding NtrC family response regulator